MKQPGFIPKVILTVALLAVFPLSLALGTPPELAYISLGWGVVSLMVILFELFVEKKP